MMIKIGDYKISTPIFLAPMAGITDYPTRVIMNKFGVGLSFSEMINATYISKNSKKSSERLIDFKDQQCNLFAVQLVGNDPETLKIACKIACDRGADIIDFNLGCPVKKVTNGYGGSALLKDIDLVKWLIEAIVEVANVPVTIKCRIGWDEHFLTSPIIVSFAEEIGISLVSIHARTRSQLFSGKPNWKFVNRIKKTVNIPIMINGDIINTKSAIKAMTESKCDGIMIGRGLMGKPWLIPELAASVFGIAPKVEIVKDRWNVIKEHVDGIYHFYGSRLGNLKARKHIKWYLEPHNIPIRLKKEILNCPDTKETFKKLDVLARNYDLKKERNNSCLQ